MAIQAWICRDGKIVISDGNPEGIRRPWWTRGVRLAFDIRNAYRTWRATRSLRWFCRQEARRQFWIGFWRFVSEALCAAVMAVAIIVMFFMGMVSQIR